MQGKARTHFRCTDWTRPMKDAVVLLLRHQYREARGEQDDPYLVGMYDGTCDLLYTLSPDIAADLIREAERGETTPTR